MQLWMSTNHEFFYTYIFVCQSPFESKLEVSQFIAKSLSKQGIKTSSAKMMRFNSLSLRPIYVGF